MLELVKTTFVQIFTSYSQYVGNGMYFLLFLIAIIYIYITERKSPSKTLLCYYPLVALLVIFNPFIASIIIKNIEDYVYWRMFWILPITTVIAYAATKVVNGTQERSRRVVVIFALIAIIVMSGKFIFTSENYSEPSNWYKLPMEAIEVSVIIKNDSDGAIRAVVPAELAVSIRQYDADIELFYGRNGSIGAVSNYWYRKTEYELMKKSELNVKKTSKYMSVLEFNYLVLKNTMLLSDDLEKYGYKLVATTESYDIYKFDYAAATEM